MDIRAIALSGLLEILLSGCVIGKAKNFLRNLKFAYLALHENVVGPGL